MSERILSNINYAGFIIQEVELTNSGTAAGIPSTTVPAYKQFRITWLGARPKQFVPAMSQELAKRKVDEIKKAFLVLNSSVADNPVSQDALDDLVRLGLIYKRGADHFDTSDEGEALYDSWGIDSEDEG